MKPIEGRKRIVIEHVRPSVNCGRYPIKCVLGDSVEITAAIFGDGHDHVAARLLYRHASQRKWQTANFTELPNDMWAATLSLGEPNETDKLGAWSFTIEAWVDHFDTWTHDLAKRLAAQAESSQDIPLALRIGANHVDAAASRAKGADAKKLNLAATKFRALADSNLSFYDSPIQDELVALVAKYPDLSFSTKHTPELSIWVDRERAVFSSWYELFPRSASAVAGQHGTLRDVADRIPEIAGMGFDVLYMPPIHPIGVAYRKGPNNSVTAKAGDVGSPWAIGAAEGGHTAILPELGTFEDFDQMMKVAAANSIDIALDIAFQCSPDHPWVTEHPSWFIHRPDGTIQYAENPPKKYQDIYPLNFESPDWRGLWDALYGVFKFWSDRGVRVFRVDNPHTKALPFWEWCIAEVLKHAPDTIFLAEAFTRPHVMYALAKGGFTQSYTYFTWRNTKAELVDYFTEICNAPVSDFFRPNVWPNTPDILHAQFQVEDLAQRRAIFRQRVILAATLSSNYGIYGPAYELLEGRAATPSTGKSSSEEYLDSEKYQIREWDRSDPNSIAPLIASLNHIRRENLALQRNEKLHFHTVSNDNLLAYSKSSRDDSNVILTVVNLDPSGEQTGWLDLSMPALGLPWIGSYDVEDLLTGAVYHWKDQWAYVALSPEATAHVFRIHPAL
ncbi:MAG: alpha-1,4-glucan--maltose-1-phosphate maltosyltransferase [Acidobacteria bacterium]|nr:alpha-1,4-glucan--maltose-1-phosphate maltosyltransferase [Acidobacteriota bacterium]